MGKHPALHRVAVGQANRLRIYEWFRENPCHTQRECADALRLSRVVVSNHCCAIRDGWRPSYEKAAG